MKRGSIFSLVTFMLILLPNLIYAQNIADSFRFPLDGYNVGCNDFWGTCVKEWHLGEDAEAIAETPVYAIGNGVVKHAQYHAPVYDNDGNLEQGNYGGMYIIEHTLPNGEQVCAVYAHLNFDSFTKNITENNNTVKKDDYLGEVGTYAQNGGWDEHLHLGIRKGAFPSDWWRTICDGEWIFGGYTKCTSVKDDWYDPTAFIESHQCADTPQNLSLARIEGQGTIYWFQNNKKYHILSPQILADMSSIAGWNHICDFPSDILDPYTEGPDFIGTGLSSDDLLIQVAGDPKVFLIENGKRRWITSEAVFNQLGYDWYDVIEVTETILNSIPEGNNILSRKGLPWIDLLLTDDVPGEKTLRVPARYPTIQAAIDAASNGDTVLIADGTYTGTGNKNLDLKEKNITVRSENGPKNCIIDCQGDGRGFFLRAINASNPVTNPIISGLTITNGNPKDYGGGGIYSNVTISPTIKNCIISKNKGGGICISSYFAEITNCLIVDNITSFKGGGIYADAPIPPRLTITNSTICGNIASEGGGIYAPYSSIKNSILWGDSPEEISGGTPATYSDIQGGYAGEGNINVEPQFVGIGNYRLTSGSPCIDTGTPIDAPSTDIEGISRPHGIGYDMGAYEFH